MRTRLRDVVSTVLGVIFSLWIVAVYVRELSSAEPVLDDVQGILTRSFPSYLSIFSTPAYRVDPAHPSGVWGPLPTLLQQLVGELFGRQDIAPFRFLVLAFHVINAALASLVVRRLRPDSSWVFALWAWIIALVHPLTPDTAAWASELFDATVATVCLIFLLLTQRENRLVRLGVFAFVGSFAALSCKPSAMLVGIVWILPHLGSLRKVGSVGIGAFLGVLTFFPIYHQVIGEGAVRVGNVVGLNSFKAWTSSLGWWLLLPHEEGVFHLLADTPWSRSLFGMAVMLGGIFLASRSRVSVLLQPIAVWCIVLAPAMVFAVPNMGIQPWRYAYFPLMLALPFAVSALAEVAMRHVRVADFFSVTLLLWTIAIFPRTLSRIEAWRSDSALQTAECEQGMRPIPCLLEAKWNLEQLRSETGFDPHDAEFVHRIRVMADLASTADSEIVSSVMVLNTLGDLAIYANISGQYEIAFAALRRILEVDRGNSRAWCLLYDTLTLSRASEAFLRETNMSLDEFSALYEAADTQCPSE